MKKLLPAILFFTVAVAYSQTKISGTVRDETGDPIPMANIILMDTYDGASSDVNGNFEFVTSESGSKILAFKFLGFKENTVEVNLEGKPLTFSITLHEMINELEAVTISAGSFTASDAARRTVFRAVDIATTAGATADIAGALNTLPGTQKVGESGKLFVRGGEGNETRTFIDGMVVLDAYNPSGPNTPSRGRFLPFMFKGTSFSTGGYSAEFGQALSSVLALDSRDETEMTRTDIGILSVGADVAHTQAWERGSVAGKIQYTNLQPYMGLIDQRIDWKKAPSSIQAITAFRQHVGKDGMVKFYGNLTQTDYSLYNHSIDNYDSKQLFDLNNNYRYLNGFYKDVLSEKWIVRGGVSYTFVANDVDIEGSFVKEIDKGIHVKTVFDGSLSDKVELKTGVEVIQRDYTQNFSSGNALGYNETIAGAFAETDLYASNNFVTRAGARLEYDNLLNKGSVDPRLSMAYKTGATGQVAFAYGQFRQSPKNEWLKLDHNLQSERAEHFILNYQRVENDRTFRIETYYKKYNNLIKFTNADYSDLNNNGNGYAKGIELFWRDNKSIRNADYWISYSFLDTKRTYLNFPIAAQPSFASRHNFSAVYKHFITEIKSQLGVTYSLTSGRPYYNPNNTEFNSDRTPSYSDLSFNWSYLPKPYLIVYFSCTNLLGRNNIFGYEYSSQLNEDGLYNSRAIRQAAPRFLFVGIFLTLSKNKSINQLPTL
jgi:hypothetical protein